MEFVWAVILCVCLEGETCDPYNDGVGSVIVFKTQAACEKVIKEMPTEFTGKHSGTKFRKIWGCYKTEVRR